MERPDECMVGVATASLVCLLFLSFFFSPFSSFLHTHIYIFLFSSSFVFLLFFEHSCSISHEFKTVVRSSRAVHTCVWTLHPRETNGVWLEYALRGGLVIHGRIQDTRVSLLEMPDMSSFSCSRGVPRRTLLSLFYFTFLIRFLSIFCSFCLFIDLI